MSEAFNIGDRVVYCGSTSELRGMMGIVTVPGSRYIGVDFDESVKIGNRNNRFWRCQKNLLTRIDDTTVAVQYSFEDFLKGGDLNG